ncbi:MAG: excalibur calcium-binding domain-containing protein [Minisyncoccia bacterium]
MYNCSDFSTHAEAQATFEACGGAANDIHRLDSDKDGSSCESLP